MRVVAAALGYVVGALVCGGLFSLAMRLEFLSGGVWGCLAFGLGVIVAVDFGTAASETIRGRR